MLQAQFRIELPSDAWVAALSRQFPAATFRLLSGLQTPDGAVELGEVLTDDPAAVSRAIESHAAVSGFVELAATDRTLLVKYATADATLYAFAEGLALPPEFPVVVRDGWYAYGLTGTRAEFDRLRRRLAAADCRFELVSVVGDGPADGLLTDRQAEVLTAAVERGYFAVPRTCTLSDLSAQFDADESTLSGVLRRAQQRVLSQFLAGPTPTDGAS